MYTRKHPPLEINAVAMEKGREIEEQGTEADRKRIGEEQRCA